MSNRERSPGIYKRLMQAAEEGDIETMRSLPINGAKKRHEALFAASAAGRALAVAYLLDIGADIHRVVEREDALSIAAGAGQAEVIRLLLERGANPRARKSHALCRAAMSKSLEAARLLLDAGAQVNPRDDFLGDKPLEAAAQAGDAKMLALLVERGADIQVQGQERALWEAIDRRHREAAQFLIDAGADPVAGWEHGRPRPKFVLSLDIAPEQRDSIKSASR